MTLKIGEFVIYSKLKTSSHPSLRAKVIFPAKHGDYYSYIVDKLWKVVRVYDENTIEIETRRGKRHRLNTNTPLLRKTSLWDRVVFRNRFF